VSYIDELRASIRDLHNAGAVHVTSVPVREVVNQAIWEGTVEVFMPLPIAATMAVAIQAPRQLTLG
jgi:hypothetical protein